MAFLLGNENLDLGPCNAYWDTATGGADIDLGGFDSLVWRFGHEKTDLTYAQYGTGPANRVVTASTCEIELGMAMATPERLAAVLQGADLVTDTAGEPIGFSFAGAIGERDDQIWKQMKIVKVEGSVESTDPMDEATVFRAAPTGSIEFTYDAASQRFARITFTCYRDPDQLDSQNRPQFFGIGSYA